VQISVIEQLVNLVSKPSTKCSWLSSVRC